MTQLNYLTFYLMTILLYPLKIQQNARHGGVGLFFKNSLPIKIRDDLSFEESIVVELKIWSKEIIFPRCYIEVLPSFIILLLSSWTSCQTLPIYIPKSKMKIHMHLFLLGILMVTLSYGGLMGDTTAEGREIENLLSSLSLSQLISEPTNFEPNKKPLLY